MNMFNIIKITCHSSSDYQKINCYAGTVHLYSLEKRYFECLQIHANLDITRQCVPHEWMYGTFWCGCVVTHLALHTKAFFFPAFYCRVFGCKNGCVMNM